MMRKMLAGAAVLMLAGCSVGTDVPVAKGAVDAFHKQFGAGQCEAIYKSAHADFTKTIKEADWVSTCTGVHAMLGGFKSAEEPGWSDNYNNGVHTVTLSYDSVYEKATVAENFLLRMADGKAALAGYSWKIEPVPATANASEAAVNAAVDDDSDGVKEQVEAELNHH